MHLQFVGGPSIECPDSGRVLEPRQEIIGLQFCAIVSRNFAGVMHAPVTILVIRNWSERPFAYGERSRRGRKGNGLSDWVSVAACMLI